METSSQIIAIVGPTCSGKSSVAVSLACKLNCSILSADAMQVYRGMDIGTGKAFDDFGKTVVYGIDLIEPHESYSASLYQAYGRPLIDEAFLKQQHLVICGGTGFYIRALLDDMDFAPGEQDHNPVRSYYAQLLQEKGSEAVWEALNALDPTSAALIHPNNSKRVIRALEMVAEGESYATRAENFSSIDEKYPALYVAFDYPREELYEKINKRVDFMIEAGLVAEVQGLLDAGFGDSKTAREAIGYKEIVAYLRNECSLQEAVAAIKQATRRYAKRQLSWFRRDTRIHWIDGHLSEDEKVETILRMLDSQNQV